LARTWCAVDGDAGARSAAELLVSTLGAHTLSLSPAPGAAQRYHTAASLLSNGSVALTALALELAGDAVSDPEQARRAFLALLQSSVVNMASRSCERALTGPIARGEIETLRAQLDLLRESETTREVFRALSREMIQLALRDGRIDEARAAELARVLDARAP
jgi:predicted short-subunit dehydrogenase-like oxidoreductase (DUF2520 family)